MATLNVLGVSGSMRANSHSGRALAVALESSRAHGAETRVLDLREVDLPVFRPDVGVADHTGIRAAAEAVRWADAYVLASPDYHGSVSGAVKNLLDYHWGEWQGKLFGYIIASHEKGLTAMDQMRTVVRQCYGWSLPYGAAVHGHHDFDAAGELTHVKTLARLRMLGRDLAVYGSLLAEQYRADLGAGESDTFARKK